MLLTWNLPSHSYWPNKVSLRNETLAWEGQNRPTPTLQPLYELRNTGPKEWLPKAQLRALLRELAIVDPSWLRSFERGQRYLPLALFRMQPPLDLLLPLQEGADASLLSAFSGASLQGSPLEVMRASLYREVYWELFRSVERFREDYTPLQQAIVSYDLAGVRQHAKQYAKKKAGDLSSLMMAVFPKALPKEELLYLLSCGEDPNELRDAYYGAAAGVTALMLAAITGDLGVLDLLLSQDAEINLQSIDGKSALWFAIRAAPSSEVVRFLLERGASVREEHLLAAKESNRFELLPLLSGVNNREFVRCKLSLRLDKPQHSYRPGEVVFGEVVLEVSRPLRYRKLLVTVAPMSGNEAPFEIVLEESSWWQQGPPRFCRFSFVAPAATPEGSQWKLSVHLKEPDLPVALRGEREALLYLQPFATPDALQKREDERPPDYAGLSTEALPEKSETGKYRLSLSLTRQALSCAEPLIGDVTLLSEEGLHVYDLRLRVYWEAVGEEGRFEESFSEAKLSFQQSPGIEQRIPIRCTAPEGPLSYRGRLFRVDWWVEVTATLSSVGAVLVRLPFLLSPGLLDSFFFGPSANEITPNEPYLQEGFFRRLFGDTRRRWEKLSPALVLSPEEPRLGDALACTLTIQAPSALTLDYARVKLLCGEQFRKKTQEAPLYQQEQTLSGATTLQEAEKKTLSASFVLPKDAPTTLLSGHYCVRWVLCVSLSLDGEEIAVFFPLLVAPSVVRADPFR